MVTGNNITFQNECIDNVNAETTKLLMKHVLRDGYHRPEYAPIEVEDLPMHPVMYSYAVPDIDWYKYIDRVYQYSRGSNMVFILSLILITRTNVDLNVYNAHRLLITSVSIAAKYLDNRWYSQNHYARVGGLNKVSELNKCEIELLKLIDFRVHVSSEELLKFIHQNMFLSTVKARL